MSSRPGASIVICAYTLDRWNVLVEGIKACQTQRHPAHEIILVCDHNDKLRERARTELAGVKVIQSTHSRGLSGARNAGIDAATGDIVVFLDDDARPDADWLRLLLEPFAEPEVVGVGGAAKPRWATDRPHWFPEEFLWIVGCSYRGLPARMTTIRNPIGCSMAFRRNALVAAGGFAVGLGRIGKTPLGCEETELSIRVRGLNPASRILYVPDATVSHLVTAERVTWAYFRSRCFAEGISKAAVTALVGADDALSSERGYVSRTLPRGVLGGIRDGLKGDLTGLVRAGVILSGLAVTTAGYMRGRVARDMA
jgi:GT2 family glycosyltransferase